MYEEFYGFHEKPFSLTPDPKYVFFSRNFKEALDHILYAIRQREGFVTLTGDIGKGKTTLCRTLLQSLDEKTKTAMIFNPLLSELELLQGINQDFGIRFDAHSKKELIDELNTFLLNQLPADGNAVLIIDEAQNLSMPVLEQLRILSNLETDKKKLLQIVLVGQLELMAKLKFPALRQLNQRISIRATLQPLIFKETGQYINHRLIIAGSRGSVTFTRPAVRKIYQFAQGTPRLINLACDRALLAGYVNMSSKITRRMVKEGIMSLGENGFKPKKPSFLDVRPSSVVALGLLMLILALLLYGKW